MFLNWFSLKKDEIVDPRHEKLIKLMKLENFNHPDITFKDSLVYMSIFNPDKISIDPQDCNIIISGFVNLELNMKRYKMLVMIKLHQSYPEFKPLVYIQNKTLKGKISFKLDNTIILNTFYQEFDQEFIMLKLAVLEKWYIEKIPDNVCKEIVEILTNHFPFIQKEQDKSLNLHQISIPIMDNQAQPKLSQSPQKQKSEQQNIPIVPKVKEDEQVVKISKNAIQLQIIIVKDTIKQQKHNWFELIEQLKLLQEEKKAVNQQRIHITRAIQLAYQEIQVQNQWLELEGKSVFDIQTNEEQVLELYSEQRALHDVLFQIYNKLNSFELDYEKGMRLIVLLLIIIKQNIKMIDQLNNWDYCNPSNFVDPLPQPYRFINKILQKDILSEVYNKIFEIEKYRSDPNYEGQLRTMPPQGVFDLNGITCISQESSNSQVVAGDSFGNIMLLDLSKKMRVAKKELTNKRIIKVCQGVRENAPEEQKGVCLIAAIAHQDPTVYILRYKQVENKIYQHHVINLPKTQIIGDLPINIELSVYCQYITVSLYNGSILVYKIPDIQAPNQPPAAQTQQASLKPPQTQIAKPKQQQQEQAASLPAQVNLDYAQTEIKEPFYKVLFKGIKKEQKYEEIILKLKEQYAKEPEPPKEDPKAKKAPAPAAKKVEVVQQVVEEIFDENMNTEKIQFQQKQDGQDISPDFPEQRFKPFVQFYQEKISQQQGNKTFNNYKSLDVVQGIVIGWTNTKRVEIHKFASNSRTFLPDYLQPTLPQVTKFEPKIYEVQILYQMSCLSLSSQSCFLAIGMVQGSVYIYDMTLAQEKYYLDKHIMTVTHLQFCDDWRLISGSYDGSIQIYDLRDGKLLCKRTNQFRKGTKVNQEDQKQGLWRIVSIGVSHSGIAVALDAQKEARLYDVWHGEKIAKLGAQQVMDDKRREWNSIAPIITCYKNEILISSNVFTDNPTTSVQIFKIFDNLVNLFSSLANVYRKGVEKDKIINLFERIEKKDLSNPTFEVPNLMGTQASKLQVPDNKSQHQSSQRKSMAKSITKSAKKSTINQSPSQTNLAATNAKKDSIQVSLVQSLHKSIQSDQPIDFNSSFRSQQTSNSRKNSKAIKSNNVILTKEMLHPEQYLLERERIPLPNLIKDELIMVDHCRQRNGEKMVRLEKVDSMIKKIGANLQLEEEKKIKEKLLQKLSKIK